MKIMTDKQFREELEKALWERDRLRDLNERCDKIMNELWEVERRINALEARLSPPEKTCEPEKTCAPGITTKRVRREDADA